MQLTCTEIRRDTQDINTYWFEADQSLDFIPGQFLPIQVEIDGAIEQRCYSLASQPGQTRCSLTIKRVNNGLVSNHLADSLSVGDTLQAMPAAGEFNAELYQDQALILLSAGCGITPVYSMLVSRLAENPDADIVFVHSASTAEDRVYVEELEALASQYQNLQLVWCVSNQSGDEFHARLSEQVLAELDSNLASRVALMCGPDGYMQSAQQWLESLGLAKQHIHHEQFQVAIPETGSNSGSHTLTINGQEVTIDGEQTVLDALESEGLPIFAACRAGVCGSCRCKGDKSKLVSSTTGPLSDEDVEQGYFLACASQVNDDMFVEIG
ncbi:iron-sulfur cluster-binding domain-containing protein [Vibrio gallicus]|uniref:iron-sulfur cluster-binding domain-containing protein n=1 Tax=Vibrio gallicus TaxID=190897 RepID=UPI0021C2BE9D|nr:iron-sulfur cluster-binding domain-containing protein [Vibrio gallicus]